MPPLWRGLFWGILMETFLMVWTISSMLVCLLCCLLIVKLSIATRKDANKAAMFSYHAYNVVAKVMPQNVVKFSDKDYGEL